MGAICMNVPAAVYRLLGLLLGGEKGPRAVLRLNPTPFPAIAMQSTTAECRAWTKVYHLDTSIVGRILAWILIAEVGLEGINGPFSIFEDAENLISI